MRITTLIQEGIHLIYKTRATPKLIIGQHALLKRLPPTHHKYEKISTDFYNGKAGFGG
ncbi:hypothetical protein HMPREF9372_1302 [Sporosarcina newyorkensis 2681]|uniref:Uncharacterized protein n=1 Tax=Sporosarcina newyorkensis 2681 TaxID=1027292 RepID=F9DR72_9BACL|nr:hypothetical protein HMPREF9372_1302 [Sporosarcina newyorkensis 2681]